MRILILVLSSWVFYVTFLVIINSNIEDLTISNVVFLFLFVTSLDNYLNNINANWIGDTPILELYTVYKKKKQEKRDKIIEKLANNKL